MTENVETTASTGAAPQPTGAASGGQAGTSAITEELLQVLRSEIQTTVERTLQGQKDKRVAGLIGKVTDLENLLARQKELAGKGFNEAQTLEIMRIQEAIEGRAPVQTEAQRPGSPPAPTANLYQGVIEAMGLDVNSPEVIAVLRTNADPMGQLTALAAVVKERRQAAAQPNPAQQAAANSGTGVPGETIETLTEQLNKAMEKPTQNMPKIRELKAKLANLRG